MLKIPCACTRFSCMHNTLVHAQHSCACTGGARAQGQGPRPGYYQIDRKVYTSSFRVENKWMYFRIHTHYVWFRRLFFRKKTTGGSAYWSNTGVCLSRFLCMHKILVHAQHSCACTTLLCMHWRGQGQRPGPKKSAGPGPDPRRFFPLMHNTPFMLA